MLRLILTGAATAALLAGCQAEDQDPVSAVQDAASVPVGQTSAATLGANTVSGYVPNAAMGDMYEIQAAEIAAERATTPAIRPRRSRPSTGPRARP